MKAVCENCKHFSGTEFSNQYGECFYPVPLWLHAGTNRMMDKEQDSCPCFESKDSGESEHE